MNPAHERLFGRSLEQARQCNYRDYYPPESLDALNHIVAPALGRGESWEGILEVKDASGRRFPIWERAGSIIDDKGNMLFAFGFMHDVSEQKQLEEKLIQARMMAEYSNKAKGEFLARMSHEIRTPISGIIGMAEMMLSSGLSQEAGKNLEMIKYSTVSLLNIINDILDFSKIEAGKLELFLNNYSVSKTLMEIIKPFNVSAHDKGLDIRINISPDIPKILHGDPLRLGQVIRNLLGNAIKFTEQGQISIDAAISGDYQALVELLITVTDTGIGIPRERLPDLFEMFSQINNNISKNHAGTGLGLAISKKLVEMMGGDIWVESQEGRGSIFYFTVFLKKPDDESLEITQETGKHPAENRDVSRKNILVAEDDPLNRKSLVFFLEKASHHVKTAGNGNEVLRALQQDHFDLILMDVHMPEMNGIETTRKIRSSSPGHFLPDIPIIALSACAMKGDRERFLEAGMNDYLSKPFETDELFNTIRKVLAGKPKILKPEIIKPIKSEKAGFNDESFVWDIKQYMKLHQDKEEYIKEMFQLFISEAAVRMKKLDKSLLIEDSEATLHAAHSISNLYAAIRLLSAVNSSREIEIAARSGDLETARELYKNLNQEMKKIIDHIQSML
ncbi:ATP-binding protein [Desulfobacterales bacterium HSG17]|nr:ATP-binding protein [Desulfobacterales bacterium HSG17]